MFVTARFHVLCICLSVLAICDIADAHNLFVMVEHRSDGPDSIDVIFEHSPILERVAITNRCSTEAIPGFSDQMKTKSCLSDSRK